MKKIAAIFNIICAFNLTQSITITNEMKEHFLVIAKDCQIKNGASDDDLGNLFNYYHVSCRKYTP